MKDKTTIGGERQYYPSDLAPEQHEQTQSMGEWQADALSSLQDLMSTESSKDFAKVERLAIQSLWSTVLLMTEETSGLLSSLLAEPLEQIQSVMPFTATEASQLGERMRQWILPPEMEAAGDVRELDNRRWYKNLQADDFRILEQWRQWLGENLPSLEQQSPAAGLERLVTTLESSERILSDLI